MPHESCRFTGVHLAAAFGLPALGLLLLAGMSTNGLGAAAGEAISLAPHRAVYEITLDRAGSASGIGELKGRMVYEITGSRQVHSSEPATLVRHPSR